MEKLWDVITGAPWWVYVLFIILVNIGIKATKPRTLPIKRVWLFPLIFIAWSLWGLYEKFQFGFYSLIPLWIIFISLGAFFGVREVHSWHFKFDHHKQEITIPGNYSTLVLIVLIFVLKFFWGYFYATREEVSYWIFFSDILTSSLVTGFFVGRAGFMLKKYYS
jgi:hypothetical protein